MATRETGARSKRLSRRDFGQQAALTLAAGALASAGTLSPGEVVGADGADSPHPMTPPAQAGISDVSPDAQAEIDRKLRHIFALYGDRLSDEQRKMLHGVVTDHVRMLDRIRAIKVHNSDPPAAVLKLIDGPSTGP
jgi:hypothetical protein